MKEESNLAFDLRIARCRHCGREVRVPVEMHEIDSKAADKITGLRVRIAELEKCLFNFAEWELGRGEYPRPEARALLKEKP